MIRFIQPNILLYFFLCVLAMIGFFFAIFWPHTIGFYTFIIFTATGGLGVALYIYYTKKHHGQLVCPTGSNCNTVVNSRYSKFLGVSLEYWGMLYYSVIITSYLILILAPQIISGIFLSGLIIFTATAFMFSLYLLFVQAFLLRQWCIWCLLSAMLSILIFIVSLASLDFAVAFLIEMTKFIEIIRDLGFVLGMGGATAAMFLFFRFLRDLNIDKHELQALKGISELVWLGLVFIFVGKFALFITNPGLFSRTDSFLIQIIALFVVVLSGAVLMIILAPFLGMIPFNSADSKGSGHFSLESLRKPLFINGAIALSSWYFAFIMNYISGYRLFSLFLIYILVLVIAVLISLFWERVIIKRGRDPNLY